MNIAELKEAAEKAEPGPWHLYNVGDNHAPCPATEAGTSLLTVVEEDERQFAAVYDPDTAAFIALANPSTILSLIASHQALVEALRALYDSVDSCVDLTPAVLLRARTALQASEKAIKETGE